MKFNFISYLIGFAVGAFVFALEKFDIQSMITIALLTGMTLPMALLFSRNWDKLFVKQPNLREDKQ